MASDDLPLRLLRRAGFDGDVKVEPLPGGITNRNYLVVGERKLVLRIGGKGSELLGIDRRREAACAKAAASHGLGPEVVRVFPKEGAMLTAFVEGRPVDGRRARDLRVLRRFASALARLHRGRRFPGWFSAFGTVRDYLRKAETRGVRPPRELGTALGRLGRVERALGRGGAEAPCHNDLLAGNLLDDGRAVRFLDWEYAASGDRFFDLGNFVANQRLPERLGPALLAACGLPAGRRELARLALMRLASDMRESLWGFLQSGVSDLDFDFRGYGRKHLARFLRRSSGPAFERQLRVLHG